MADWYASVGRNGITWTFGTNGDGPDGKYWCGQFITGDWWVKKPAATNVTVQSKSPAPSGSKNNNTYRHGDQVNPGTESSNKLNRTGLDGRFYDDSLFDVNLVKDYPITLTSGDSLVSAESETGSTAVDVLGSTYNVPDQIRLHAVSVLTCVASDPASNAFRPPWSGSTKPIYTEDQINWGLLPNLTATTGFKTQATYESWVANPWFDCFVNWPSRRIHPSSNMPNFGREIGGALGEAATWLCTSHTQAEKRMVLIGLIQIGIDWYHNALINNVLWAHDGGNQMIGRKFPIQFAGKMLGQTAMQTASYACHEDQGTYFGDTNSPPHTLWTGWATSGHKYAANVLYNDCSGPDGEGDWAKWEHVSPANWLTLPTYFGQTQSNRPYTASGGWEGYSRHSRIAYIGQALVARIIGFKTAWNHDAFFAMCDRWMYEPNDSAHMDEIVLQLWSYTQSHPPPTGLARSQGDGYPDCDEAFYSGQVNFKNNEAWSADDAAGDPDGPVTLMWFEYRENYDTEGEYEGGSSPGIVETHPVEVIVEAIGGR